MEVTWLRKPSNFGDENFDPFAGLFFTFCIFCPKGLPCHSNSQYDSCTLRLSSAVGGAPVFDSISEFNSVGCRLLHGSNEQVAGNSIFPHFPQKEHDPLAQCLWQFESFISLLSVVDDKSQICWSVFPLEPEHVHPHTNMHKRDNLIREYLHEWRV